jgi:site-specific DNA-cytosine methylase
MNNIVSLCDGISVGKQALDYLNIKYENYHAFEIKKSAIAVSEINHPEIIRHGDLRIFTANG